MVKRSSFIMKRILQIIMIHKGLKVDIKDQLGLFKRCYMWVNLM